MNKDTSIIIPDASALQVDTSCIDVSEVTDKKDKDFLNVKGENILRIVARAALEVGFPTATDLADWLVRELGLPFREAHHATGRIVSLAEEQGCLLENLSLEAMQSVESGINSSIYSVLSVDASAKSRTSFGGTAPENVRAAAAKARERFL